MDTTNTESKSRVEDKHAAVLLQLHELITAELAWGPWIPSRACKTEAEALAYLQELSGRPLRTLGLGLWRNKDPATYEKEWVKLHQFYDTLLKKEFIGSSIIQSSGQIKGSLNMILDDGKNFPNEHKDIAQYLHDRFTADNWGVRRRSATEADLSSDDEGPSKKKRAANPTTHHRGFGLHLRADPRDPVFGDDAPMENILCKLGANGMKLYVLRPDFTPRDAKVYGHNGLYVGQCWARQIALFRDGGHGHTQAGISGNGQDGAYSVIVSGAYDELDKDKGDTLFYSGSNSHTNTGDIPLESVGSTALKASLQLKKPVRVFRTSHAKWSYAPKEGCRYDGLYQAVGSLIRKNDKGGAYLQFRLDRLDKQDDIVKDAPSRQLARLFQRVDEGYSMSLPSKN